MADQDITQRELLMCEDTAAKLLNGFIFHGAHVIRPEELILIDTRTSAEKTDEEKEESKDITRRFHERIADLYYLWKRKGKEIVIFNLENQMKRNGLWMLYRSEEYAAAKKRFWLEKHPESKGIPLISIVINWSEHPWTYPQNEHAYYVNRTGFEEIRKYVNDYRIHVLNTHGMSDEEISRYSDDIRVVFENLRGSGVHLNDEVLDQNKILHPRETGHLLTSLLNDRSIEDILNSAYTKRGDEEYMTMRTFVDEIREQGEAVGYRNGEAVGYRNGKSVGYRNGEAEGRANGVFEVIMNAVKSFGVSFDDALNSLVTDESERDVYRRMHEESQKS